MLPRSLFLGNYFRGQPIYIYIEQKNLLNRDPFQKRETTMYKKIIGLFCMALMVTLVGCGASHPPLTIVTGTVTYDGEPLADATIAIMPDLSLIHI